MTDNPGTREMRGSEAIPILMLQVGVGYDEEGRDVDPFIVLEINGNALVFPKNETAAPKAVADAIYKAVLGIEARK